MSTQQVDSERRLVLSDASPGDVFEVEKQGDGRYLLVRVEQPQRHKTVTREESREAIRNSRIQMNMSWEELRKITREP